MPATTCPNCGRQLTRIAVLGRLSTAPWLCSHCARGFWVAELTERDRWSAEYQCFLDDDGTLHASVQSEREQQENGS